ncbi:hypothetical protein Peur_071201 [Populus x canadensis]
MFSPPDGDLQLLSTWLKPLSSLATYVAINRKKSASFLSSIQQKESHEEFQYSNLLGLNEEEFDRSRVVRVSDPKKCVLVAACSDDDHLNDAPSTLEDTFIGVEACFGCVGLVTLGSIVVSRCMSLLDMLLVAAINPISLLEFAGAIHLLLHPITGVDFSTLVLFHLLLHLLLEWGSQRGLSSSLFTSQQRVLDGASPSRDLVNVVELVGLLEFRWCKFMDAWLPVEQPCCLLYGMASSGVPVINAIMVSLACVLVTSWISLAAKWPAGLLVGLTVSSCYLGSAVYIVLDVVVLGVAALVPFVHVSAGLLVG